jgi:hypothetical protein
LNQRTKHANCRTACIASTAMETLNTLMIFITVSAVLSTGKWIKLYTSVVMYDADMDRLQYGSRLPCEFDLTSTALAFCCGRFFLGIDWVFSLKSDFVELPYSTLHVISQSRHHKLIYSNFKTLYCALLAMD